MKRLLLLINLLLFQGLRAEISLGANTNDRLLGVEQVGNLSFTAYLSVDSKKNENLYFRVREKENLIFSYSSGGRISYYPSSGFEIHVEEEGNALNKIEFIKDDSRDHIYTIEKANGLFSFTGWPEGVKKAEPSSSMLDITEVPWLLEGELIELTVECEFGHSDARTIKKVSESVERIQEVERSLAGREAYLKSNEVEP